MTTRPERNTLYVKRWRVKKARHGGAPLLVDNGPTRTQLTDLRAALGTWADVAELFGCTPQYVCSLSRRSGQVGIETARRVAEAWQAHCGARWATDVLRDAIMRRWGSITRSPLDDAARRYIYRYETIVTARADQYALACELMPHEVWPDWNHVAAVAGAA